MAVCPGYSKSRTNPGGCRHINLMLPDRAGHAISSRISAPFKVLLAQNKLEHPRAPTGIFTYRHYSVVGIRCQHHRLMQLYQAPEARVKKAGILVARAKCSGKRNVKKKLKPRPAQMRDGDASSDANARTLRDASQVRAGYARLLALPEPVFRADVPHGEPG
jgi:hypothetical protein